MVRAEQVVAEVGVDNDQSTEAEPRSASSSKRPYFPPTLTEYLEEVTVFGSFERGRRRREGLPERR